MTATSGEKTKAALCDFASHARFWLVAVGGLAFDLFSKQWAFHKFPMDQKGHVVIPKVLEFETVLNEGALFGIGRGKTYVFLAASVLALGLIFWMFSKCEAKRWFFQIALGALLAGALGNMYDRIFVQLHPFGNQKGWTHLERVEVDGDVRYYDYPADFVADGVKRQPYPESVLSRDDLQFRPPAGCVRDFIKIPTKWFGDRELWPWVFNVADMLLVGGVGVLVIYLWRDRKPKEVASEAGGDKAKA